MVSTIGTVTLPMQRPNLFNTPSEPAERDRVVQMRKDYREVDKAVADMKERIAAVRKLEAQEPGRIEAQELHFVGNYGRLKVNSELRFDPETGIPSRFYQHHEGSDERYSYTNQGGVETLGVSPTRAGVTYVLDHNQGTITVHRTVFRVDSASNGGWGGVYAAGVASRPTSQCQEIAEVACATAAGTLLGAGLGLTAGHLVAAAVL